MPEIDAENTVTESPDADAPASNAGLHGALRFVLVFLISTAVLLTASRYAVGTPLMNRYLYAVASHTSLVLRLVVYSSSLEEAATRRTNAAGIRNTLSAWAADKPAPESMAMTIDASAPPLTPWESWQYRVGQLQRDIEADDETIATLEAIGLPEGGVAGERLTRLEINLDTLETSSMRQGPYGSIRTSYPNFTQDMAAIRQTLDQGPAAQSNSFTAGLADLETAAIRVRDQQLAHIEQRRSQSEKRLQYDTGPLVSLTLTAGKRRQLDDARAALAKSEAASGKADEPLRARIESLQKERAEATPEALVKMDKDVDFRFSVVPDCGALPSMAIFVAAMLAFPTRWWKRLVGIAAGLPLLYGINVVRLVCLGLIGAYYEGGPEFDFAHHYVWQGIYIVFVVAIWMVWVEVLVKPGPRIRRASAQ